MRKIVLFVVCLLLSVTASVARVIPREQAAATAATFFRTASPSAAGVQPASLHLVKETPSMYVFEKDGGGYVIASADDVAAPVLAYAPNGRFPLTDMPVNMRSVIDWYERVIAYARAQGWESQSPAGKMMAGAGSNTEVLLKTAHWGQGSPFNDLSPVVGGYKCPSGCVATAMAIIMKYYEYPEHGTGELPGYNFGWDDMLRQYNYHIDGYALGHTYDWANMPDNPKNCTEYQAAQIAQLLYDLAVMSQMDFSPEGSGAASICPLYLQQYFSYDKSMRYEDRSFYTTEKWEQLIRDELDAGRPVFHCGVDGEGGGHAFVIDGYKSRYFSINYGWSEGSAWYTLSPVEGHEKELTEFTNGQCMVVRIFPDAGGETCVNVWVPDSYLPFRWNFEEKTIWGGWFWLWDISFVSSVQDFAYGLFDRNGKFKKTVSETVSINPSEDFLPEVTITLPNDIADGDQILLARREGSNWTPLLQSRQSYICFDRSRKLSEMVSVGHSFGPPDNYSSNGDPVVFFDMYKDIWWSIETENGRRMVDSSLEDLDMAVELSYQMLDSETGMVRFVCKLHEGTYWMTLRNFGETLRFRFKI